jgi:hypothetical protein
MVVTICKTLAANQIGCGVGNQSRCTLKRGKHKCTIRFTIVVVAFPLSRVTLSQGRVHSEIWPDQCLLEHNDYILRPLNATKLEEAHSSLSSAFPLASSYTIDRAALFQFTSTTGTPSTSPTMVLIPLNAINSLSPQPSSAHHDRSSGSTTGEIIGGIFGGPALLSVSFSFFWHRRRDNSNNYAYSLVRNPH